MIYLSGTESAGRLGIRPKTWSAYVSRGYAPPPDARIGDTLGWLPETLDRWQSTRPGQGARPLKQRMTPPQP